MKSLLKKLNDQKIALSLVIALTFLVYANTLVNGFVIEDQVFISNWELTHSLINIPKMIAGDTIPTGNWGAYRPVRAIIYALSYSLFGGDNPFFYHLQALLVHIGVTVLIFFVTSQIFLKANKVMRGKNQELSIKGKKQNENLLNTKPLILIPLIVSLLFGLHPIHTEVVDYLTANFDALSYIFFFASFYLYLKAFPFIWPKKKEFYISSIIMANLAFYASEMTLTLPFLILFYEFCFRPKLFKKSGFKDLAKLVGPFFVSAFIFLFIRFFVMQINVRGEYLQGSVYFTALTMLKVILKYFEWLIFPLNLSINPVLWGGISAWNHPLAHLERVSQQSLFEIPILASLGLLGLLGFVAVKVSEKQPLVTFSIGWFFISILPVLYIIPQGTIFQERYIYIASFGFCLILGYGLFYIFNNPKSKIFKIHASKIIPYYLLLITLLAGFYGVRTYLRNIDWKDSFNLWTTLGKQSPDDVLGNFYAGREYAQKGMDKEALDFFQRALNIEYRLFEAHFAVGEILRKQGNIDQAATKYYQTLAINPNFEPAQKSLNQILVESTASAQKRENAWINCNLGDKFAFSCPEAFEKNETKEGIILKDENGFTIQLSLGDTGKTTNLESYFALQKDEYGKLVNQGQANFLNFDLSWVKVWDDGGVQKLQFFLFKGENVIKVLVYPADSPLMVKFERIVSSIKLI